MKRALKELNSRDRSKVDPDYLDGMRLFHFFSVDEIVSWATSLGLEVLEKVEVSPGKVARGTFTYRSGKGMPTAAVFFKNAKGDV